MGCGEGGWAAIVLSSDYQERHNIHTLSLLPRQTTPTNGRDLPDGSNTLHLTDSVTGVDPATLPGPVPPGDPSIGSSGDPAVPALSVSIGTHVNLLPLAPLQLHCPTATTTLPHSITTLPPKEKNHLLNSNC